MSTLWDLGFPAAAVLDHLPFPPRLQSRSSWSVGTVGLFSTPNVRPPQLSGWVFPPSSAELTFTYTVFGS